ncbi:putative pheromone maturation-related protein [Cutaneotrichosporon oleaginosum]|uniref:Protein farnesyltransferase/geranylgeranyltransferase type-1 subunit alpha n=1 Tax=Cutaneotrichosporon oleaginosum TaxID=879819 RepID=A0A0J0XB53_9TREE|nr:putative pheromone maturation-related protein [Cutaneotrichosporon oleaginosum]KLT38326.1 putative pheromone maturation-related protein [Cutaneotrichosporon oleaginosum]
MADVDSKGPAPVPLSKQPEWSDVVPVPQDDGPDPLVPIMYSPIYREHMDYFRAVSATGERSDRVLELTEAIVRLNPAHYTVWQYRFATLVALKKDLAAELDLMNEFARANLKSYQVWHHRLLLLEALSPADPVDEIAFIHDSLGPDTKNYHTWAYLHWLYCHFSGLGRISDEHWARELEWCDDMLKLDGRNNSAWGWRWFLRMARPGVEGLNGEEEIKYALEQIHIIPHNASAWNYLRGVVRVTGAARAPLIPVLAAYMAGSAVPPRAPTEEVAKDAWPNRSGPVDIQTPLPVPLALEFQADALVEGGRLGDAAAVYGQLGASVDRMRSAYWEMRRGECVNA